LFFILKKYFDSSIQVYPALHIEPRVIVLVVGAEYQVTATGGPYPEGRLEYYVTNRTVCDITSEGGLITANVVGSTTVQALAILAGQATADTQVINGENNK